MISYALKICIAFQATFFWFHNFVVNHTCDKFVFWLSGAGNLLNAILDAIFIFLFGLGVGGTAVATVISEYVNNVLNYIISVPFAHDIIVFFWNWLTVLSYRFTVAPFSTDILSLSSFSGSWMTKCSWSLQTLMQEKLSAIWILVCILPASLHLFLIQFDVIKKILSWREIQ